MRIQAIATQGMAHRDEWVTSYKVTYSTDRSTWTSVTNDDNDQERTFGGNSDRNTVVENSLNLLVARYVRLHPRTKYNDWSLRWEVYGCRYDL